MYNKISIFTLLSLISVVFFYPLIKANTIFNLNIVLIVLLEIFLNIALCVLIFLLMQENKFRIKSQTQSIYAYSWSRLFIIIAIGLFFVFYLVKNILLIFGNITLLLLVLPLTILYAFILMNISANKITHNDDEIKTINFTLNKNDIEEISLVEKNHGRYSMLISTSKNKYSIIVSKHMLEELINILPKSISYKNNNN